MKNLLLILRKKKYDNSIIHLKKILHTQEVINACIESLNKKKKITINYE